MKDSQQQTQTQNIHYFTLGNFQKDLATLVDSQYNLIQIPKSILPLQIQPGSIIKISISRDTERQKLRQKEILNLDLRLSQGNYTCGNILNEEEKKGQKKQDKSQQMKNRRKLRSLSKKNQAK